MSHLRFNIVRRPENWVEKRLGDIVTFSQGKQVAIKEQVKVPKNGYARFIRIVDYTQNTDDIRYVRDPGPRYFASKDDIVMVRYGSPGLIGRGLKGVIANNLFKISIEVNDLTNDYLALYLMQKPIQDFLSSRGSATMPALNFSHIKNIIVSFPRPNEQKRIVAILDEAFESITQAVANAEKNLANARELFVSYLTGIFSQKGEGWVEKPFAEVCVLQRGFDLPKRLRSKGDFPLVSSSGIIDTHIEPKVEGPGVATGRSGSIGNVFFIEKDYWPLNTVLYVKEFYRNDPYFIYYFLKYFDLGKYSSGAGVPTLNRNHVHSIKVCIPSDITQQRRIVWQLNRLLTETQHLESIYQKKLTALAELKQSILQKAFSGSLTGGR